MLKLTTIAILSLIGCGGSATVNSSAVSNTNVNVDSQNGDTQCSYHCEPVQFEGGVGYLVTQECNGTSNGPDFSPVCPTFSSAVAAAEEVGPIASNEAVDSNGGLSQEVL